MASPLAPGDTARLIFSHGQQDHTVRMIDGVAVYITAEPDATQTSLVVPDATGNYQVDGLDLPHAVQFIAVSQSETPQIALTGVDYVDLQILQELDDTSLLAACETNQSVARLCRIDDLWIARFRRKYGARSLADKPGYLTYRQYYLSYTTGSPVAAGRNHSVVVTPNGEVLAFGSNEFGQLGLVEERNYATPTLVSGLPRVRSVAASLGYTLFLTDDGTVYACGHNQNGQLGIRARLRRNMLTPITGVPAIRNVYAGVKYSVLVDINGIPYYAGKIPIRDGRPTRGMIAIPGVSNVRSVALGTEHTLFLTVTGAVYAFGHNSGGALGLGDNVPRNVPTLIPNLPQNIREVYAGAYVSFFLTNDGVVYACGTNPAGHLGLGDAQPRNVPTPIMGLPPIRSVASNVWWTLFLTAAGTVYAIGDIQDASYNTTIVKVPTLIPMSVSIASVAAGAYFGLLIASTGEVYSFGNNAVGQLGLGDTTARTTPTLIPGLRAKV